MTHPRLVTAMPLEDYKLALTFSNDEKRVYDFAPNLGHKFYKPLSDIRLFRQLSVVEGELEWVTGQDFCPHTLYEQSVPM